MSEKCEKYTTVTGLDYANLRVKATEERAEEAWALTKLYQESNDKVGANSFWDYPEEV